MLHQLPTEIALQTISYLPLQSLYSIILVSRDWNALVVVNEPTVYKNAAVIHRFIDKDGSDPVDWKVYCRRQVEIERGWRGKGPSVVQEVTATGNSVHRIKIDYELGFVITTCQNGGLFVCDIKSNRILWALAQSHVVRYAHLEYDRGYIVFNRLDNCKEVWRRTLDVDDDQLPGTSLPDKKMLDASARAVENYGSAESYRGHFKPWALLHIPEGSRAFRFAYPTLLAVATNNAYVWDIPSSNLVFVIRDIQQQYLGLSLGGINYVEVNDLYVFVCGTGGLRIFAREGGALLYQLPTRELSSANWDVSPQTPGLASSVVHPQMLIEIHHSLNSFHGDFMACHVSPSGNDLAVLTTNGRLVILPHFQRLFSGSNALHHRDIAIILNFRAFSSDELVSCYLAVGNPNGKLAVATRKGIYVISCDFDFVRLTADRPLEPGVSVCRLSKFENENLLFAVTCLQVTHDAVYFTYKASHTGRHTHVQGANDHDPPNAGMFQDALDVMGHGEGFADQWQDEDDEDEEEVMEMGAEDDDGSVSFNPLVRLSTLM